MPKSPMAMPMFNGLKKAQQSSVVLRTFVSEAGAGRNSKPGPIKTISQASKLRQSETTTHRLSGSERS